MVKQLKNIALTLLLLTFLLHVNGQTYLHKNYNVDNGLLSSETYRVFQDSKGFIWITGNQGVSRYNGYEFEGFDMQDGLPENTIIDVYEDKLGKVWFISLGGQFAFYENERIMPYRYNDTITKYTKNFQGILQKKNYLIDSTGSVYLGFYKQPILKISPEGFISEIQHSTNKSLLLIEKDDLLLHAFKAEGEPGAEIVLSNGNHITIEGDFSYIARSNSIKTKDKYLFSRNDKLSVISPKEKTVTVHQINADIAWLSDDSEGNIWMGTFWNGAKAYSNTSFINPIHKLLYGNTVTSVIQDNEGGYWFSTLENGIYYFPSLSIKSYNQDTGLKTKTVLQVEQHGDEIWFGGNSNELYFIENDTLFVNEVLKNDQFMCYLLREVDGNLMMSSFTKYSVVNALLSKNNSFTKMQPSITSRDALAFNNQLWLFYKGCFITDFQFSKFEQIQPDDINNSTFAAIKYNDKTLWLGTSKGLYQLSLETLKTTPVTFSPHFRTRINCFFVDTTNYTVWIGTKGAGLLHVKDSTVTQLNTQKGLISNSISSIQKDDSLLWIGTNNGVGKIRLTPNGLPKTHNSIVSIEHFSRANGLINNEVNDIALLNGNVYVGTSNGISYFSNNINGENEVVPPIYITGVRVMNTDTLLHNSYKLKHNENYIEIGFVGLSYQRFAPLKYEYMLKGIDTEWNSTTNRTVQYSKLLPGTYTFNVRVANRSGLTDKTPATISFTIKKAYYQTFWFKFLIYGSSVLLIAFGVFLSYQNKLRNLEKRNLLLDEVNKFRQRALSAQMNPHFIYNSLNSIQSYILKNEPHKSSKYLSMFGKLMRRILENSQQPAVTLDEEIEALKLYVDLELLRFYNSFTFHINIQNGIDIRTIKIPPLVIQPYVENAIHHGLRLKQEKGNLWLSIQKDKDKTLIIVEDDGVGREKATTVKNQSNINTKSYGTEITSKRLSLLKELYKNEVSVRIEDKFNNGVATGTRVELVFKTLSK